jgi:hypothetical protein
MGGRKRPVPSVWGIDGGGLVLDGRFERPGWRESAGSPLKDGWEWMDVGWVPFPCIFKTVNIWIEKYLSYQRGVDTPPHTAYGVIWWW